MRPAPSPRHPSPDPAFVLYRPAQVAEILGCSEWWVKEQARRRRIPFSRIGGGYRFTADHLAEIIRIFEERPAAAAGHGGDVLPGTRSPQRAPRSAAPVVRLTARPPRRARTTKNQSPQQT
ncbi:helix-turn-helix domain-containing protein [Streptomyces sp. NPDC001380]|uniref:helix-turn-helix domain-containing protein n=1 Tax=Streptomyces sp. NPDC001380 TaxID=3364566 RepID=UPI0036A061A6